MAVCVLWMAEAALWMLFDEGDSIWAKTRELASAAYFIVDGLIYCYEWAVLGTMPKGEDILFYASIDVAMYVYYFVVSAAPNTLTSWIPRNSREIWEMPSYKAAISISRKALIWWLPMVVLLTWLRKHNSQTWDESLGVALFSVGLK